MTNQTKITEIVEKLSGKPLSIAPDESLFESGVLDSFALTDMVGALEKEFSIRIPDADLTPRKFDSIVRIEAYVAHALVRAV
ncbi:MAG TPA: acyl carrier protein [Bryobacteraceae bacterium]|nr:acyl carrier protein [Bryobacteraceae bacterium]